MELESLIQAFVNNGTAIAVTAYFLFRDYKFQQQLVTLLTTIENLVEEVKNDLERK